MGRFARIFSGEKRGNLPRVRLRVEACLGRHPTGQEAHADWSPWHEANAQLFADIKHAVVLGRALDERVLGLDGGDRLHGMGATDIRDARFRETEMQHLARLNEVFDRSGNVFHRHLRVNAVLVDLKRC
jgi:hypothetical protein